MPHTLGQKSRRVMIGITGWARLHIGWRYHRFCRVCTRYSMSPYSRSTPRIRLVVDWGELVVDADETFKEGPVRIMDSREQVLRGKTVRMMKVL